MGKETSVSGRTASGRDAALLGTTQRLVKAIRENVLGKTQTEVKGKLAMIIEKPREWISSGRGSTR